MYNVVDRTGRGFYRFVNAVGRQNKMGINGALLLADVQFSRVFLLLFRVCFCEVNLFIAPIQQARKNRRQTQV